jgi:DNA-directed RNA polymerase specialized sigma24 family protein
VRHTLAKLSPQDRRVLYLCDVAGFPATEAAVIVNVEAPALRQRLRRARNRFRRLYGEAG